jgi:hypothetical protein
MKTPPYYSKMHSGNLAIVLDSGVDYDSFPTFAKKWISKLSLKVKKQVDGAGERIWGCEHDGYSFWLAYDDWFPHISLEPQNAEAGEHILSIGLSLGLDRDAEPGAPPNSRRAGQLPASPQVQSSDSQRTPSSGGCG